MISVNKVVLLGHAGKDGEFKTTSSGETILEFSLATNRPKSKTADWHAIEVWNPPDWLNVQKGDTVFVEGSIRYNSYQKDGHKRTRMKVVGYCINLGRRIEQEDSESPIEDLPF